MSQISELQLYFGDDFIINEKLRISQPTIGDVVRLGEDSYFSMVYHLTMIPSDMKSTLFDIGIDWMELSDLQLFFMLTRQIPRSHLALFFGDLDFSDFLPYDKAGDFVMYSASRDLLIDKNIHRLIAQFLCRTHNIKKKVERAGNAATRQVLIDEERARLQAMRTEKTSSLLPLISSLVNWPGFKYSISEVRAMTMYQFMDSVMRVQHIDAAQHAAQGFYSGNFDVQKFDTKKLYWMGELPR